MNKSSKSSKSRSGRSMRDNRNAMRRAFEKYETELYPNDVSRLARSDVEGVYLLEEVQVGYIDWRKAWGAASNYVKRCDCGQ